MKAISVFNNKGGVGKTTLTFHMAHALAAIGKKVLIMDLDPQCNITVLGVDEEWLHRIWEEEDRYIDDFKVSRDAAPAGAFKELLQNPRSIHFILMPTQEGTGDLENLPPPISLSTQHCVHLIPGRLTMHLYEDKISSRWSDVYQGDPLAIRTVTRIRTLAEEYARLYGYDYVIMDTSPSLGTLNKVIISTTDGFMIPCMPDMFSLYGIKNLGSALSLWKKQFYTIYHLLSDEKRKNFPDEFVRLLGFTIYNAKRYAGVSEWDLAKAHYNYAMKIPGSIVQYIDPGIRGHLDDAEMSLPIGGTSIMHTHNTLPGMSQKYHKPMWEVPAVDDLGDDANTVLANRKVYEGTLDKYIEFTKDFLLRMEALG